MRKLMSKAITITTVAAASTALLTGPASAGEPPNTYGKSNRSTSFAVCGSINCPYGPGYLVKNYTMVVMRCYGWGANWEKGNYYSTMWFKVYIVGLGDNNWVHSSYIYKQASVGRC